MLSKETMVHLVSRMILDWCWMTVFLALSACLVFLVGL